jgi:ketosteroid isomerase-like protein
MDDTEIVLALERTWSTAPVVGDLATVSRVVADDWLAVAPNGQTMNKAELLEMLASRPNVFDSAHYSDVKVRLFGCTAVVTSFFEGTGKDLELRQRYLRVYAKRDARWACVATQIVPSSS